MDAAKQRARDLRRQLRSLQQKKRRADKIEFRQSMRRQPSSCRALLVYFLAEWDLDAVIDFVRGRGQRQWQSKQPRSAEEATSIVASVQAAWVARSARVGPHPSSWPDVSGKDYRVASRFVLERRLYSRLWMQNCVHGVAPSRAQLVDQVGVLNAEWPPAVREATCLGRASARTQGKWLASFRRRRWQARIGVLKVQEDLPVEVMQAKVGLRLLRKGLRPRNGPKKDAAWRSRFWGRGLLLKTLKSRLCFWYLFRGRLAAPKLGTIFCGWFWGPRRWQSSNGQTQPQRLLAGHRCY